MKDLVEIKDIARVVTRNKLLARREQASESACFSSELHSVLLLRNSLEQTRPRNRSLP